MAILITILVYESMYKDAIERSEGTINNIVSSIQEKKLKYEIEVTNVSQIIENSINDAQTIISNFLIENNWAATAKLAYLDGKGEDCAYISYRDRYGKINTQKFTDKEDYTTWDWYKNAIKSDSNDWNNIFYNKTQELVVIDYACPIRDKNTNEIIAIWAVDLKFVDLDDYFRLFLPYSGAYGYIIDENGLYLAHPNKSCELHTYDEIDEKYHSKKEKKIYDLMLQPGEGSIVIDNSFVIYRSVNLRNASLAIVCPFDQVFTDVFTVQKMLWILLVIAIAIVGFSILYLTYRVLQPLQDFAKAVKAVSLGTFDAPIPEVTSKDELRYIHDAIKSMQSSLSSNIKKLQQKTRDAARMDSELVLARQTQQNLLSTEFSPFIDWPQLDIYAKLQPARAVGGDLYDFFIRDSKLFFIIADVSGKGIPASLFMSMAYKVFRVVAMKETSPAVITSRLNEALADHNKDNMFITTLIGVLDLISGELTYTNAGHNPPLIISDKNSYMDVRIAVPVAAFSHSKYLDHTIRLKDGAALLLYTDGVVEATNRKDELYGEDKLVDLITDNSLSSSDIVEKVYNSVVEFANGAPQNDDITLLCIRYNFNSIVFRSLEELESLPVFVNSIMDPALRKSNYNDENVEDSSLRSEDSSLQETSDEVLEMQSAMLNLALEELLVNILQYSNSEKVSLSVYNLGDQLKFTIIDSGIAFDPTKIAEVDINQDPSQRTIGGLGIHFAREIFSKLEYKRIDDLNLLYAYYTLQ